MHLLEPALPPIATPNSIPPIAGEERRQRDNLELIASENYASAAVREAMSVRA